MALDKILIGTRIRELRERILEESREEFAKRCDFSDERYVGQLERGEFLPSLESLYKCKSQYKIGSSANNVINIAEEPFVLIRQNYIFHT